VIKIAVVGLGKMGLSHKAIVGAHRDVELAAVCDSSSYVLGVLHRYTGVPTYTDYKEMLERAQLDAVIIATPSSTHASMVEHALDHGLHVLCEKPFTLHSQDSERLARLGDERGLVTQVGYHNRFVAAFGEAKALLDAGAIGRVTHALAEAYGPVVLKPKGGTWRSKATEGGGCLYDYAAHAVDLINWYLGEPTGVGGTVLNKVFSRETEDEVFSTLYYPEGKTAQLSVNWSDESYRKMTTRITLWGTAGRIYVDRQECQTYLRDTATLPPGYELGWNVRYTTDLTPPVWFYLRGEEYSAQVDAFVQRIKDGRLEGSNGFASAASVDKVIALMLVDARRGSSTEALEGERVVTADGHNAAKRPLRTRLGGILGATRS
jgi:scyllo-inositol 2-dehydrogenase (NADP+)